LADVSRQVVIPIPLLCNAGLETKLSELKDAAHFVMDLYVPQEEWVEPQQLVDRLDEVEGCIKSLLLDAAHLAAAAALSTINHHDSSFDLPKVSGRVDLLGLIRCEEIVAAASEVVKKFDFGTN
jgi:hypothetical protein